MGIEPMISPLLGERGADCAKAPSTQISWKKAIFRGLMIDRILPNDSAASSASGYGEYVPFLAWVCARSPLMTTTTLLLRSSAQE